MIIGKHRHQIDEKGRFRVPAKLRRELGDNFYIVCGPMKSLMLMPEEEVDKLFDKIDDVSFSETDLWVAKIMLTSSTEKADEDAQGRIVLSKDFLAHANIKKNLVSIGARRHIELWAEEAWDEFEEQNKDFRQQYSALSKRGI